MACPQRALAFVGPVLRAGAGHVAPRSRQRELGAIRDGRESLGDGLPRACDVAGLDDVVSQFAGGPSAQRGVRLRRGRSVRFLQQLRRACGLADVVVDRANRDERVGPRAVWILVLSRHDPRRPLQQVARGERRAHRCRVHDQECIQVVDGLGPSELPPREVPLCGHFSRLSIRTLGLGGRATRLREGPGEAGDERERGNARQRDRNEVPSRELSQPIPDRIGSRRDRQVAQITTDVVLEGADRGVALGRRLLQRLGEDRIDVAGQLVGESLGRCRAGARDVSGCRRRGVSSENHLGCAGRIAMDDGFDERRRGDFAGNRRVMAGQELIEQNAKGVDVGGGSDRRAGQLLRCRERRRERTVARSGFRRVAGAVQQLRDPEVEQLDVTFAGDEHVGWLDVAVHDEVGVRVRDRREYLEEQAQACVDAEAPLVAVAIDVRALHVLEDEIGGANRRHPGVEQPRDARMGEPGEDACFSREALATGAIPATPR